MERALFLSSLALTRWENTCAGCPSFEGCTGWPHTFDSECDPFLLLLGEEGLAVCIQGFALVGGFMGSAGLQTGLPAHNTPLCRALLPGGHSLEWKSLMCYTHQQSL